MNRTNPNLGSFQSDFIETIPSASVAQLWTDRNYSAAQYVKTGLFLGAIAGCTSLLFNIVGSVLWPAISGVPQHALRLIQVYLTFPLGEKALHLESVALLAFGCFLYVVTGMIYGMLFEWLMSLVIPRAELMARIVFCSILALVVWAVNFYGVLIWLQPLIFGQGWIIKLLPWWVAALTHLVYGCTMACIYPLGERKKL